MTHSRPFLSFYTPSFCLEDGRYARPQHLAACRASVGAQSIPCQHYVAWDATPGGSGIAGMYAQVPAHAANLTGEYVHFLADDDTLVAPDVAERVQAVAIAKNQPEVIVVRAVKNGLHLPIDNEGPPHVGRVDLGCFVMRRDVWLAHAGDYGLRYEGDGDHAMAMWNAGRQFVYTSILFETGPALHGAAE